MIDLTAAETSIETGTAIIAVNDFYVLGENVNHFAILFENPKTHTYAFVSVQAAGNNEFLTPEVKYSLTKEEAMKTLYEREYTRFKTFEVNNPNFENADAEIANIEGEKYETSASTPLGPLLHLIYAASSPNLPDWVSKSENCLTGGIKILEEYGAKMPAIEVDNPTPKGYYEEFPSNEEYVWNSNENKYIPTSGTFSDSNPMETDFGGINFSSIKLNYISVSTDQDGSINFDLILKAQKADSSIPGIDLMNSSSLGVTAFMTGLVVPESKFWVNLNPWEQDRIIDQQLNTSEVGRIMLEADLQMKRSLNNYVNPCANETGAAYWNLLEKKHEALVQQCMNKFPEEIKDINNIRFHAVSKQWIVPDKIYAYANGTEIYIINATLTINSESDPDHSSFLVENQDGGAFSKECLEELNKSAKEFGEYVTKLKDSMILPYVISDVNHGEEYESIRDIYISLALAQWYKSKIATNNDIFREMRDSLNSTALESMKPWSSYDIWKECVSSVKNGEYKCWINETIDTASGPITKSRSYSTGGVEFHDTRDHFVETKEIPPSVRDRVTKAIQNGFVDEGKDVSFGIRLHADQKEEILDTDSISSSSSKFLKSKQEVESNSSTCPEGWTGPDEKGECWKIQIITEN